jgi:hypothetical protein
VRRAVEENVFEPFLERGDLHCGFARIRCGGCGHDPPERRSQSSPFPNRPERAKAAQYLP